MLLLCKSYYSGEMAFGSLNGDFGEYAVTGNIKMCIMNKAYLVIIGLE